MQDTSATELPQYFVFYKLFQTLSMYKTNPRVCLWVLSDSLVLNGIKAPRHFFQDLQGRAIDMRLLRLGALLLMALTHYKKSIFSLAKYLLLHMRSIHMENYEQ